MENINTKKLGYISGSFLILLSFRSFFFINDLLTGFVMLFLGISILYANETD
jgi:hypothetical protein